MLRMLVFQMLFIWICSEWLLEIHHICCCFMLGSRSFLFSKINTERTRYRYNFSTLWSMFHNHQAIFLLVNNLEGRLTLHFRHAFQSRLPKIMIEMEKSTTTYSLFMDFLKFYLWLFVAFSTNIPQIKWPGHHAYGSFRKYGQTRWFPNSVPSKVSIQKISISFIYSHYDYVLSVSELRAVWFTEWQNDIYIGYSVITHMDHSESTDKRVDFRTLYQVQFQYKRYQSASLIVINTMYWVCSELYDSQNDIYIGYSVIAQIVHSVCTDKVGDFQTLYQVKFQ